MGCLTFLSSFLRLTELVCGAKRAFLKRSITFRLGLGERVGGSWQMEMILWMVCSSFRTGSLICRTLRGEMVRVAAAEAEKQREAGQGRDEILRTDSGQLLSEVPHKVGVA